MTAPLIEISHLSVDYETPKSTVHALTDFNLRIHPGQTVAIVGESGSGKTTVSNALIGLLPRNGRITQGTVSVHGTNVYDGSHNSFRGLRGHEIGYIPQDPASSLNSVLTIGHQFRETIHAQEIAVPNGWSDLAIERLSEVGLTDGKRILKQYPHELSGGMLQRILIALALLSRPSLIIADEPTSALDVIVQQEVLDNLRNLIEGTNAALVLVTHDLGLVADRAESVLVMHNGRVVESGPTQEVIEAPGHPYTRRLLAAIPRLSAASNAKTVAATTPILELRDVSKHFAGRRKLGAWRQTAPKKAVDGVSLSVGKGECRALVGESGSGKSTIARLIIGLEKPTHGEVLIDGVDRHAASQKEKSVLAGTTQIVFQNPFTSIDPQHTIRRVLEEPLHIHRYGDSQQKDKRTKELLDLVGLPASFAERYPSELSGGQCQRVAIARAVALNPQLLICDEAVSALDVLVQDQILTMLRELRSELDLALLFITHDLGVVAEIADTVSVISNGTIVEEGPVQPTFENPHDRYTRQLLAAVPGRDYF